MSSATIVNSGINSSYAGASVGTSAARVAVNSSVAIILTQILASTKLFGSTDGAAPMELNLNQLLNNAVLTKNAAPLPPELLAKPQVIDAIVLQNTLLPASTNNENAGLPVLMLPNAGAAATTAALTTTLYRVNIEWQNRILQLLSSQPLPTGSRIALQIDAQGAIKLLRTESATNLLQPNAAQTVTTPTPQPSPTTQALQQSLRELLPRQQALHTLVPLLQKFITPAMRQQLPQPIAKAIAQILQSLPKPAQLNSTDAVKEALHNSGNFLETRLASALTGTTTEETVPQILAADLKSQLGTLLQQIRKLIPDVPSKSADVDIENALLYTAKPNTAQNNSHTAHAENSDDIDNLLTQLSKLLESGLARIQLNQLDSVSARHPTQSAQTPVPTWVLELPLRTAHGVDQLHVRFEKHAKPQQQQKRVQWNVEIALDLHAAGKIAASLAIIDKSVSATLWAEQEQTHLRIRDEMNYLRAGLESVGVNVTDIQCRLGLPVPKPQIISQQLVDVRT